MARISVVGSGRIGATLASKWMASGHEVTFGARDPDRSALLEVAATIGAARALVSDAVRGGDVIVFAIPGAAMAETVSALGADLDGKVVVDAANNMGSETMNSRAAIEAAAPSAAYFRAFNTLGWEQFERPVVGGVQADLFYCGPDGDPRASVEGLIADVGLRPVWLGGSEEVEVVDALLLVWLTLVRERGLGRRLAFKMIQE